MRKRFFGRGERILRGRHRVFRRRRTERRSAGTALDPTPEAPQLPEDPDMDRESKEPETPVQSIDLPLLQKIRAEQQGREVTVTWKPAKGAAGYTVRGARFDQPLADVAEIPEEDADCAVLTSLGEKKIGRKAPLRFQVLAYCLQEGERKYIAISPIVYVVGEKNQTYTNPKRVKVKAREVTLRQGEMYMIEASVPGQCRDKELYLPPDTGKLRYFSSDENIASVDADGRVEGRAKGTCTVCVMALNGMKKKVKVTVV